MNLGRALVHLIDAFAHLSYDISERTARMFWDALDRLKRKLAGAEAAA